MNQLFEFPDAVAASTHRSRPLPVAHIFSERITVNSKHNGRSVEYARLSDEDHRNMRNVIQALWDHRGGIRIVLDQPSGLYGSRGGGKGQTLGDILDGLHAKMQLRHPFVRGRVGEDLTIKQLAELNTIIAALNTAFGGDLEPLLVP